MSVDILETSWDQCRSMVQYSFTSTETRRLVRTDSPGRPTRLSHSSWTMRTDVNLSLCFCTHRVVSFSKIWSQQWMASWTGVVNHFGLAVCLTRNVVTGACLSQNRWRPHALEQHLAHWNGGIWQIKKKGVLITLWKTTIWGQIGQTLGFQPRQTYWSLQPKTAIHVSIILCLLE